MKKIFKSLFLVALTVILGISSMFIDFNTQKIDASTSETSEPTPEIDTNNFLSRNTVKYENINGKTVTVDTFYRDGGEVMNNPSIGQAIMLYQCIQYKKLHKNEEVFASLSSFHLSVTASVCVLPNMPDYGKMKSLTTQEFTDDGYYRIAYLLVEAAKYGVKVIVVGQLDSIDYVSQRTYFNSHMQDDCYVEGKKVKDFMTARAVDWTSYGDKAGADMMHVKSCTVSHYIDNNGVEHRSATWLSSQNLDSIKADGTNGNDSINTAVIISEHEEIRKIVYNYTRLMSEYYTQEYVNIFRNMIIKMNTEQINLINEGRENEIADNMKIVYLGSETDKVFELYFTPFGGANATWDTVMNPYSKYINKLLPAVSGGDYIEFMWNNVKFINTFPFAQTIEDVLAYSFKTNANLNNKLYIRMGGISLTGFKGLVEGENIGRLSLCEADTISLPYHSKDFQLSYKENGERYYVSCLNSLNFHEGAMGYQTNSFLVIKETAETGNDFYTNFGILTVPGVDFESGRL